MKSKIQFAFAFAFAFSSIKLKFYKVLSSRTDKEAVVKDEPVEEAVAKDEPVVEEAVVKDEPVVEDISCEVCDCDCEVLTSTKLKFSEVLSAGSDEEAVAKEKAVYSATSLKPTKLELFKGKTQVCYPHILGGNFNDSDPPNVRMEYEIAKWGYKKQIYESSKSFQ